MDNRLEIVLTAKDITGKAFKFQSLFFWIWNSDWICPAHGFKRIRVSILVFLDMEFRQGGIVSESDI
jgi:hypothetical protein